MTLDVMGMVSVLYNNLNKLLLLLLLHVLHEAHAQITQINPKFNHGPVLINIVICICRYKQIRLSCVNTGPADLPSLGDLMGISPSLKYNLCYRHLVEINYRYNISSLMGFIQGGLRRQHYV